MSRSFRQLVLLLSALFPICAAAEIKWTPPSADELTMTEEPKAPDAPAIILSYTETDDANSAEVILHVRLKILTSGGLSAGTIHLPTNVVRNSYLDQELVARTIHADGTIIPFTGTPQNSLTVDDDEERVISLPSVEVGSILEYICHFQNQNTLITRLIRYYSPHWHVQHQYFVRSAHFILKTPSELDPKYVRWVAKLPAGIVPQHKKDLVTLDLNDIPAEPNEQFAPPRSSTFYNVRFFYYGESRDKFWGSSGERVDEVWSNYYLPGKGLTAAVKELIQPSETDEQKLRHLYSAVMRCENTDFTRRHQQVEDKKIGFHGIRSSEDTWSAKRGDSSELTMLFIALARAAGFSAYPMAVSSRNKAIFDQDVLSWSQMDSMIAIININGKDIFFDPGSRLCPFAKMAPWHANVIGVSAEGKLIKTRYTPAESYNTYKMQRVAELTVDADGSVMGKVTITWLGTAGLALRQNNLRNDLDATRSQLEKTTQQEAPSGVQLKLASLTGLDDGEEPLVAVYDVSGKIGVATQKRIILPSQFFQESAKPLLTSASRTLPVAFPTSSSTRDILTFHVPESLAVEAVPAPVASSFRKDDVIYKSITQSGNMAQKSDPKAITPVIVVQRVFVLEKIDYSPGEYPDLYKYLGQVASSNQEQILLRSKSNSQIN